MDTQRLILFMLFTFSTFFLIDAYQKDMHPPVTVPAASTPAATPSASAVPAPTQSLSPTPPSAAPVVGGELQKGEQVRVQTNALIAIIDAAGGDLRHLELLSQRDTLDKKKNFALLELQPERT